MKKNLYSKIHVFLFKAILILLISIKCTDSISQTGGIYHFQDYNGFQIDGAGVSNTASASLADFNLTVTETGSNTCGYPTAVIDASYYPGLNISSCAWSIGAGNFHYMTLARINHSSFPVYSVTFTPFCYSSTGNAPYENADIIIRGYRNGSMVAQYTQTTNNSYVPINIDFTTVSGFNNVDSLFFTASYQDFAIEDLKISPPTPTSSPAILTGGSLTAFSSCSGVASSSQNFTVSGSDLTNDITVTAPSGYEVSTSSNSGYSSSLTLTQTGGTVNSTTVYVRLSSSATGTPSGNIVISSTGASSQNIAVTGTVNTATNNSQSQTACDNYIWNGTTYTASGDYIYSYNNANGCASVDTLHLTINLGTHNVSTLSSCDSLTWNGTTYYTSGTYTHSYTSGNGCPNADTLFLTINTGTHTSASLFSCDSLVWNGTKYYNSGTYTHTFTTGSGCISVDTLHLIINTGTHNSFTQTACDSFMWNGTTYMMSGTYTFSYSDMNGCASMDTLHLTINTGTHNVITQSACDSFMWNGNTYYTTGIYTHSYNNGNGCTSMDTLTLTVNQSSYNGYTQVACDSFVWNGFTYTSSGIYYYSYTNSNGCPGLDTLFLTIGTETHNVFTQTACDSFMWNGMTYTTSGTYTHSYNNATGCASMDTLYLTINSGTHDTASQIACDSYTWHGNTYLFGGTYTYSYNNANGCASVDTLFLTINFSSHNSFTETACDSFTWNGNTYTTSGTYFYGYTKSNGCSGLDTLFLTINTGTHNSFMQTACDSFMWNGMTYTTSGTYMHSYNNATGCASMDTLYLTINSGTHDTASQTACDSYTWHGNTYLFGGTYTYNYTNGNGCPSVDTLFLTINFSSHNSFTETACDSFTWNGNTYTTSGTYFYGYTKSNGCSGLDTLFLTINTGTHNSIIQTSCDSFMWNGMTYTTSGTYMHSYNNATGCASTDTLKLTINSALAITGISAIPNIICTGDTTQLSVTTQGGGDIWVTTPIVYNNSGGFNSANQISLHNITLTSAATIDGLWFESDGMTTSTDINFAIYTDNAGEPDAKILEATQQNNLSSGRVFFPVTTTTLSPGTYWIGVNTGGGDLSTKWNDTLSNTVKTKVYSMAYSNGFPANLTGTPLTFNRIAIGAGLHSVVANSTISWQPSVSLLTPALNETKAYPTTTTTYIATLSSTGCTTKDSITVIVNSRTHNVLTQNACDSFTWNGRTYTASTIDTFSYTNANGCASVDTLHLTVNTGTHNVITQSACDSFTWNGITYMMSGTYTHSYNNGNGCASADTLHLTVNVSTHNVTTQSVCDSFMWNGTTYMMSGTYTHNYNNVNGCASVDTLHLTVNANSSVFTASACDNFYWPGKNMWYYSSNNTDTIMFINAAGCDSTVTLNLTVNYSKTSTTGYSVCENKLPYVWNGNSYNAAGSYIVHLISTGGCDSAATLVLNVLDTSAVMVNHTVCSNMLPYVWNGNNYNSSGIYMWTGTNAGGCDSVVMLNLTVNDTTKSSTTASACGSYTWNGVTYNSTGVYMWHGTNAAGCDSIAILNLTILSNITDIHINGTGAFCGDSAVTKLSTNIGSQFGSVNYEWIKLGYDDDTWQVVGNDSTLDVNITTPAQYVLKVNIAGCATFYSNQETVLPVKAPTVSLVPGSAVSVCNNSTLTFNAGSTDGGVNNYAFYSGNTLVQNGAGLTYNTPALTTTDNGVIYKVQATNEKPVFDGDINENFWGMPLAVSTSGPGSSFGAGHELNAIYARSDSSNVYIAIAGNVQNDNRIMLFIDSKAGGYNTADYGRNNIGNNAIKNFNSGTSFDPGFEADYCLGIGTDASNSQYYFDLFTLSGTASNAGSGGPNHYIGSNLSPATGYNIGANPANGTQKQGFEFSIPKSALGYTGGTLRVFAVYSADNGFLSNQFLTRANAGSGSYGNGVINFGAATPNPIAIPVEGMMKCTSSATTVVTVKSNATSVKQDTVCNNMLPYTWAGKTFTIGGSYNDTSMGSNGCDSIATLVLTVKDTTSSTTNTTVCNNMLPYSWNGNTYNMAGTYTWMGTNVAGCDSMATLILTISDTIKATVTQSACDSFTWNGNTYMLSGTYTYNTMNAAGCDSMVTLNLTINASPASPVITTATNNVTIPATGVAYGSSTVAGAASYTWSYTGTGATIASGQGTENITVDFAANATNGDIQVVAVSANGCTSVPATTSVALPIIVSSFNATRVNNTAQLNWNSSIEINAKEYQVQRSTDGRNFEQIGIVAAKGFASEYQFTDNSLPSVNVIYYRLKSVDKDGKFSYSAVRQITNQVQFVVSVYPNPAREIIFVKATNAKQIRIIDGLGKTVFATNNVVENGATQISVSSLTKATYYIEVTSKDGQRQIEKFVKE